jgi:hypothetical protein
MELVELAELVELVEQDESIAARTNGPFLLSAQMEIAHLPTLIFIPGNRSNSPCIPPRNFSAQCI